MSNDNTTDIDAISVAISDDGCIVVRGEIDMAGGPMLEAAIFEREASVSEPVAGTSEPGAAVTLDLSGVSFIDSCGLRALLGAARWAGTQNRWVSLRAASPEVARLLQLTGTEAMFRMEPVGD